MKQNVLRILLMIIVFGIIIIACDLNSNNNQDYTLVAFGDSLTAGYGATTPGFVDKSKSYPSFLQAKVNIPVINAGVSRNTTSQGLSRVNADVLSKNPSIVIILLGANDFFQGIPLETTQKNLQSIINSINFGGRNIYLAKFYTETVARQMANNFGITDYDTQTVLINQYDIMFNTLSSLNNITLIEDIWQGVWGIHMSDAIHPNAAGYKLMADNIFNVLKIYLDNNNY